MRYLVVIRKDEQVETSFHKDLEEVRKHTEKHAKERGAEVVVARVIQHYEIGPVHAA